MREWIVPDEVSTSNDEKWLKKLKKDIGYKGCKNCKFQIEPLRTCKWMENGGDGVLHLICPKWERRINE